LRAAAIRALDHGAAVGGGHRVVHVGAIAQKQPAGPKTSTLRVRIVEQYLCWYRRAVSDRRAMSVLTSTLKGKQAR
jgi:hypothetical protein